MLKDLKGNVYKRNQENCLKNKNVNKEIKRYQLIGFNKGSAQSKI